VDVVVITVTESEPESTVTVEEVVMVDGEVVSFVVVVVVESPDVVVVPESVPESVVVVPPVLKATLWRLKSAMASSRGSAVTTDALSMPNRRKASDRMLKAICGVFSR